MEFMKFLGRYIRIICKTYSFKGSLLIGSILPFGAFALWFTHAGMNKIGNTTNSDNLQMMHDSGLIPSVLGEGTLLIVTPFTVTLSQKLGLTVQKGEFTMVMPSIRTFLQRSSWMNGGRKKRRSNVLCQSTLVSA